MTYEPTDSDYLSTRPCPDCGYEIRPGWEHGRMPQPAGGSHVVCSLQPVSMLRKFGPCQTCGVDCSEIWVDGKPVAAQHHGPVADDHPAKPGSLPLAEMIGRYINHRGGEADG